MPASQYHQQQHHHQHQQHHQQHQPHDSWQEGATRRLTRTQHNQLPLNVKRMKTLRCLRKTTKRQTNNQTKNFKMQK